MSYIVVYIVKIDAFCCLLTEKQFSDVEQLMDNLSLGVEL